MYLRPFPPACEEPSECKGANRRRIIHPSRSDYSDEALTFLVATVPSRKPSGREGQERRVRSQSYESERQVQVRRRPA
jgi:hypothetical protein